MHEVHFKKKIKQQLKLDGYSQNVSRKLLWQVCWQQRKQNKYKENIYKLTNYTFEENIK